MTTPTLDLEAMAEKFSSNVICSAYYLSGYSNRTLREAILSALREVAEMKDKEIELWRAENDSRSAWIQTMNKILGYDNADGFHSEPDPFQIAQNQKKELTRLNELVENVKVALKPSHRCEPIAKALMDPEREWWVGKLIEPIPEWPLETHCLHMKTPVKDVVFLCNHGDFENLMVMSNAIIGPLQNLNWLERVTAGAMKRAEQLLNESTKKEV